MTLLTVDDYKRLPVEPGDYRHPYGRDRYQFADLFLPPTPGPYPVLVLVHGGCWRAEHGLEPIGQLARAAAERGIAVWNVEYRRLGNGGGWPATLHDVGAAVDHLRAVALRRNLDLSRVVAAGHSAGGHLALWLAGRRRLPVHSPLFMPNPLALRDGGRRTHQRAAAAAGTAHCRGIAARADAARYSPPAHPRRAGRNCATCQRAALRHLCSGGRRSCDVAGAAGDRPL